MVKAARLLLLASGASACSLAPPRGIAISAIDTTSSSDTLRLRLRDFGRNPGDNNWDSVRDTQALLNMTSGRLVAHDSNLEFMPQVSGFMEQDVGSFADGVANVSGREFGKRSFTLNMTMVPDGPFGSLVWWYSASLDRFFFFSEQSRQLAVCTSAGQCQVRQSQLPNVLGLTSSNGVVVWDEERLAGLPLLCCVCREREYVTYDEEGNVRKVDALDTLGTTHYSALSDTVFAVHGAYTEYSDVLRVVRYNYATHESLTVMLSKATLEGIFQSGVDDNMWAVFVFVPLGSVLAIAVIAGITVLRRRPTSTKAVESNARGAGPKQDVNVA